MGTILIVVLLILLLGGGGGYYGYNRYGTGGLGGALGLVLIVLVVAWFLGALDGVGYTSPLIVRCRIQGSTGWVDLKVNSGRNQRGLRGLDIARWPRTARIAAPAG